MKKKDWNKKKLELIGYKFNVKYIDSFFESNKELDEEKYFKFIDKKKNAYLKKAMVKNYNIFRDIEYINKKTYEIAKTRGFGKAYKFYTRTFKTSYLLENNIKKLIKYKKVLSISENEANIYILQLKKLLQKVDNEKGDRRHKYADKQYKATLYALKRVSEFTSLLEKEFKGKFPKYIKIDDKILYTQNYINLLYKMYESHYINYYNTDLFEKPVNQTTFDKNKD